MSAAGKGAGRAVGDSTGRCLGAGMVGVDVVTDLAERALGVVVAAVAVDINGAAGDATSTAGRVELSHAGNACSSSQKVRGAGRAVTDLVRTEFAVSCCVGEVTIHTLSAVHHISAELSAVVAVCYNR